MRILLLLLLVTGLSACGFIRFPGVYRIDVEQGNIITQELADQLQPGMSRRQVRFILGTPLLEDTFNQDRWDYPYVKRNGVDILDQATLTVVFDGDSLTEVRGDYQPEWARSSGAQPGEDGLPEVPGADDEAPDSVRIAI
jgi:outer membrane protein assembly factor BamE